MLAAELTHMETLTDWLKADRDTRKNRLGKCLHAHPQLEPSIHAWSQVQPRGPRRTAPLFEIPFGVKDIIETEVSTEYGSPLYQRPRWHERCPIIRRCAAAGLLLGKTVTPLSPIGLRGPHRNPRNWTIPRAEVSGSAAAVAQAWCPSRSEEQTRVR